MNFQVNFKVSKKLYTIISIFKIAIYLILLIPLFYLFQFAFSVFGKLEDNWPIFTFVIAYILFFIIIFLLLSPVLKHLKYIQEKGFISIDEQNLILILFLRKLSVKWDNIEDIQIYENSYKKIHLIGFNFISLKEFPKSCVSILDLTKSCSGYHISFPETFFKENIQNVYSKLIDFRDNISDVSQNES